MTDDVRVRLHGGPLDGRTILADTELLDGDEALLLVVDCPHTDDPAGCGSCDTHAYRNTIGWHNEPDGVGYFDKATP